MPLEPGTTLGSYSVTAKIGEGGMGEVYRARDTELDRDVALKVLSQAFTNDPVRLARFEREARVLASLNHPNIGSIYGLQETDGQKALVLELVEGPTLADRIEQGPISVDEALPIAKQIAEALAAAHGQGVIHRDLKPANIKVREDGTVKVLDFGLAKAVDTASAGDPSQSRTRTDVATQMGVVLGTIAYMSPEQAAGRPVDARSDIFSFGVVLYELLAGRRPFTGATDLEVLQTVMHGSFEPLPDEVPIGLRIVVEKTLDKAPTDRYQTMSELVVDLRRQIRRQSRDVVLPASRRDPRDPAPTQPARGWFLTTGVAIVVACAAGAGGWILGTLTAGGASTRVVQVQRLTDSVGVEEAPALSPDGRSVAFAAASGGRRQVWVRLVAGGAPLALTTDDVDHYAPRWSPDSSSLIYFTPGTQPGDVGTIWEIPALGGVARRLVEALAPGALSPDGENLAFLRVGGDAVELVVAARDDSGVRLVTTLPATVYSNLRWSPDSRTLAYLTEGAGVTFSTTLFVVDASGGEPRTVLDEFYYQGVTWLSDGSGFVVSSSQGSLMSYPPTYNLWRVPLDDSPPAQLTFGEASYESPDLGSDGDLVVSRVRAQSDVWRFPVTGDPAENARSGTRITRQTGVLQTVSVSPDGSEVVFLSDNGGHANVWIARVANGEMRPVTREFDPRVVVAVPVWSPQGDWINFLSTRNSTSTDIRLWLARPDGSEPRDLGIYGAWTCWSGDGQWLYYSDETGVSQRIRKVRIDGGDPVTVRDDDAIGCSLAHDGTALYYARILRQAAGGFDLEVRGASPEDGPSRLIGRVSGSRVPTGAVNFHAIPSPDGRWLATPLLDGSTTNIWAIPTTGGEWRKLTDFGERNVMIARRIAWSRDSEYIYASVSDIDSDVLLLRGLQ